MKTEAVGKTYPPYEYEVGKEKIREYAAAVGEDNPVYFDRERARAAGFRDVPAPPMFAVVYAMGVALYAPPGRAPEAMRTFDLAPAARALRELDRWTGELRVTFVPAGEAAAAAGPALRFRRLALHAR